MNEYKHIHEETGRVTYDPLRGYLLDSKSYEKPISLIFALMPYIDKCKDKKIKIILECEIAND